MIPSNIVPSQSLPIPKSSVDLIRRNLNINKQYGPTYNLIIIEQVDTVDLLLCSVILSTCSTTWATPPTRATARLDKVYKNNVSKRLAVPMEGKPK